MIGQVFLRDLDPLRGGRVAMTLPNAPIGADDATVAISRQTASNRFLGPKGWQTDEYRFRPHARSVSGNDLVLEFGPELVDSGLRSDDVVMVTIPDHDYDAYMVWSGITRSLQIEQPVATPVKAVPPPIQTPEPVFVPVVEQTKKRSPLVWIIVLVTVLVLLGAGATAWFFKERLQAAVQVPPTAPVVVSDYDLGQQAFAAGQCEQARSLTRKAIEAGSVPAMLFWATQQDSVDFKPCITDNSNDVAALRVVQGACEANADTADVKAILDNLERELQYKSENGDVLAGEVLRLALSKTRKACGL